MLKSPCSNGAEPNCPVRAWRSVCVPISQNLHVNESLFKPRKSIHREKGNERRPQAASANICRISQVHCLRCSLARMFKCSMQVVSFKTTCTCMEQLNMGRSETASLSLGYEVIETIGYCLQLASACPHAEFELRVSVGISLYRTLPACEGLSPSSCGASRRQHVAIRGTGHGAAHSSTYKDATDTANRCRAKLRSKGLQSHGGQSVPRLTWVRCRLQSDPQGRCVLPRTPLEELLLLTGQGLKNHHHRLRPS